MELLCTAVFLSLRLPVGYYFATALKSARWCGGTNLGVTSVDASTGSGAQVSRKAGDLNAEPGPHWLGFRRQWAISIAVVAIIASAMFCLSPREYNSAWPDAPGHAMSGVFIRDLVAAHPAHPLQWSFDYYLEYPAVTVGFYPPLFPIFEALFYALFGVSNSTAQLTVAFFYFWAGLGAYALARRWTGFLTSLAIAIAFMGTHQVAFWGRHVMPELAAYAMVLWSARYFHEFLETDRPKTLITAAMLLLAGLYCKQTVAFVGIIFAVTAVLIKKQAIFRSRSVWRAMTLFVAGLLPLVLLTLLLGRHNLKGVAGTGQATLYTRGVRGWTFYLKQLPIQMGWLLLGLAVFYLLACLFWRRLSLPRTTSILLGVWAICGYVFFSMIAIKEDRYLIFVLFPFVVWAISASQMLGGRLGPVAAIAIAVCVLTNTCFRDRIPTVSGYKEAAAYITSHSSPGTIALYSAENSGDFIFAVRTMDPERHVSILRADKLFVHYAVSRAFGYTLAPMSTADIRKMLQENSVSYVIAEPGFYSDLEPFRNLEAVANSDLFSTSAQLPIRYEANKVGTLVMHRALNVNAHPIHVSYELPVVGLTVSGTIGHPSK